jgi:hypothetical protein
VLARCSPRIEVRLEGKIGEVEGIQLRHDRLERARDQLAELVLHRVGVIVAGTLGGVVAPGPPGPLPPGAGVVDPPTLGEAVGDVVVGT